jgi:hypothetical protein
MSAHAWPLQVEEKRSCMERQIGFAYDDACYAQQQCVAHIQQQGGWAQNGMIFFSPTFIF